MQQKDDEAATAPPGQTVTVRTDRAVTLTTTLTLAASVHEATMHAERNHKDAWRRLAHQPGVALGPVVDLKAQGIMLDALRRIAKLEELHGTVAAIASQALLLIGDRSIAPLDDTDVR